MVKNIHLLKVNNIYIYTNSEMSEKLLVPDIGDFEEVEIIEILVKEGDKISKNAPVITLESDKSSVEVPSAFEGVVDSINI